MKDYQIIHLPLTKVEANALLRLIATANDAERTEATDRNCGSWIAQRLLPLVRPAIDDKP
jgi:hypothetical protein